MAARPRSTSLGRPEAMRGPAPWLVLVAGFGCSEPNRAPSRVDAPSVHDELPVRSGSAASSTSVPTGASSSRPTSSGDALPPLEGPAVVSLEVAGFEPAVLFVPIGATTQRRLVVAAHGNYDRPEWQCEVWAEIVERQSFVLCPRGELRPDSPSKDDPRFTYRTNRDLEDEVDRALEALARSRHARYVDPARPVWAGFSLGAIMGVAIAARRPSEFADLILVEGGVDRFGDAEARAFAQGGGRRVLFACAQRGCAKSAKKRADRLISLGVEATVVDAGPIGHTYDGAVADAVRLALPAFLAGSPTAQRQ
jgi:predicted esterase